MKFDLWTGLLILAKEIHCYSNCMPGAAPFHHLAAVRKLLFLLCLRKYHKMVATTYITYIAAYSFMLVFGTGTDYK